MVVNKAQEINNLEQKRKKEKLAYVAIVRVKVNQEL